MFTDADATVSQTSNVYDIAQLDQVRIHIVQSNPASTGTFELYSRQGKEDTFGLVDFNEPLLADTDGQLLISLTILPGTEIRLDYVPTVGSGTFTAVMSANSIGA